MDTSEFTARGKTAMDSHPIRGGGGGEEMLLVASCPRNRDKLRPGRPLGSYADLYLTLFSLCILNFASHSHQTTPVYLVEQDIAVLSVC